MKTTYTPPELIRLENELIEEWNSGNIPYLTHFCGGNEEQLINIFKEISEKDWVISTHRSHYHYLLKGGSFSSLKNEVLEGRSMFLFSKDINFISTSILAGGCGIATGIALANKRSNNDSTVWCFLGDGAEEQGHFYEAVMFSCANNLKCNFIIEDNNRSVDVDVKSRRGNFSVAWPSCVKRYRYSQAFLMRAQKHGLK